MEGVISKSIILSDDGLELEALIGFLRTAAVLTESNLAAKIDEGVVISIVGLGCSCFGISLFLSGEDCGAEMRRNSWILFRIRKSLYSSPKETSVIGSLVVPVGESRIVTIFLSDSGRDNSGSRGTRNFAISASSSSLRSVSLDLYIAALLRAMSSSSEICSLIKAT